MYYKLVQNVYIKAVGTGKGGEQISADEYNAILAAFRAKPQAENTGYRLKENLEWESYELPQIDPLDEEVDDSTALAMIMEGR